MFTLQTMPKWTKSENPVAPGGGALMIKTMSEWSMPDESAS